MSACEKCGGDRVQVAVVHSEHGSALVRVCGECGAALEEAAALELGDDRGAAA